MNFYVRVQVCPPKLSYHPSYEIELLKFLMLAPGYLDSDRCQGRPHWRCKHSSPGQARARPAPQNSGAVVKPGHIFPHGTKSNRLKSDILMNLAWARQSQFAPGGNPTAPECGPQATLRTVGRGPELCISTSHLDNLVEKPELPLLFGARFTEIACDCVEDRLKHLLPSGRIILVRCCS